MKIAILGFGPSQEKAPWDDKDWEKWGLPWCERWREYDRLFEMHSKHVLNSENAIVLKEFWDGEKLVTLKQRPENYWERLVDIAKNPKKKVYTQEPLAGLDKGLESSTVYPYERVISWVGDYFTSSISYMVALAIAEMQEQMDEENTIGIWGVDLLDDQEWFYQRPGIEYLIGVARGMGIQTVIPKESRLFGFPEHTISFGGIMVKYANRYGMLDDKPQEFKRRAMPPHLFNGPMSKLYDNSSAEQIIKEMAEFGNSGKTIKE